MSNAKPIDEMMQINHFTAVKGGFALAAVVLIKSPFKNAGKAGKRGAGGRRRLDSREAAPGVQLGASSQLRSGGDLLSPCCVARCGPRDLPGELHRPSAAGNFVFPEATGPYDQN